MRQHLFLSPHFDDAVGSCGGLIARLAARGRSVRVLTVFGGLPGGTLSPLARRIHERWGAGPQPVEERRREDARACAMLSCRSAWLDIPDALYRRDDGGASLYGGSEMIGGRPAPGDDRLADLIVPAVLAGLGGKPATVYLPYGLGGHVDHVLCRGLAAPLMAAGLAVILYRDFYYAQGRRCFVGPYRRRRLAPPELAGKIAAFSEYRSQIPILFGDDAGMRRYFEGPGAIEEYQTADAAASGLRSPGDAGDRRAAANQAAAASLVPEKVGVSGLGMPDLV
ncbi:LmbE family N-acetylglucosaminyl deacetylase [Stella humosa]|uniref:LmbE family N-acetylglucosaminyl deacetylase n=2 Tax=Stella humosa TaxID=94 RepID=A0A3N1M8C5_9PROT|nr:LmbE family N-acetylglucosaminyl deacetylase [Stella humosa]